MNRLDYETGVPQHPTGKRRNQAQLDAEFTDTLFSVPASAIQGMVRGNDCVESQVAAVKALRYRSDLHKRLLLIFATEGDFTGRELKKRKEFAGHDENTILRRITDLKQNGDIVSKGRRDNMNVWGIP